MPRRARVSVDEYLAQVCRIWEMEPGDLLGRRKDEGTTRMREREDEAFHERRRDLQKRLARGEVERPGSRR